MTAKSGSAPAPWRCHISIVLAVTIVLLAGCAAPRSRSAGPEFQSPAVASTGEGGTRGTMPAEARSGAAPLSLEPADCPPNSNCLPGFKLNGVSYTTTVMCDQVKAGSVGALIPVNVAGQPVPRAISRIEGFPISAGVVAEWDCNDWALALPVGEPERADVALRRAQLRCSALAYPRPRERCDQGGSARWRAGDAWYDYEFTPFPGAVVATDAAIDADDFDHLWRTDPLEVGSRRFVDEGVCKDDGEACTLKVNVADVALADGLALLEGVVEPLPNTIWDITIRVERLGERSWWTTAMTIEPRDAIP